MSKAKTRDPDIADEYDFSKAERGVYHERAKRGSKVHLVTDEEDRRRAAAAKARQAKKENGR
jgi:hypothetical protein